MELQWPLILFTTFIAWSAGLFGSLCYVNLKGESPKSYLSAWIIAAVLLVIGGVAVFFHLQHWERIFNGFGHITSGITQELIGIVVLAIVAIIFIAMMRKSDDGQVPAWLNIVGIIVSVVLVLVMCHSYMMPSRPAWDTVLQPLNVLGSALVMGPATMAFLEGLADEGKFDAIGQLTFVGSIVNVITMIAYIASLATMSGSFLSVGYSYDPTHPTKALTDVANLTPFGGDAALTICGALIIGAVVPLVCAIVGKKKGNWKAMGAVAALCAVIGAICIRVVFYNLGATMFMLY